MNLLLRSEVFDNFLLSEAEIHTAVKYVIDGHFNKNFYSKEETEEKKLDGLYYMPYGFLRQTFFELIKGRRTPVYFQFVLMLSPTNLQNTLKASGTSLTTEDINAVFFNIRYQNDMLTLTTGVSYRNFITDKSFEKEWEKFTINFLKRNSIVFSEI